MGLPTSNTNTPGMLIQARKVNSVCVYVSCMCVNSGLCVYRCTLNPFSQLTTCTHIHSSVQLFNKSVDDTPRNRVKLSIHKTSPADARTMRTSTAVFLDSKCFISLPQLFYFIISDVSRPPPFITVLLQSRRSCQDLPNGTK